LSNPTGRLAPGNTCRHVSGREMVPHRNRYGTVSGNDLSSAHKNSCRLRHATRHVTARSTRPRSLTYTRRSFISAARAPVHPAGENERRDNLSPLKLPPASSRTASARPNSFFSDVPSVRVSRATKSPWPEVAGPDFPEQQPMREDQQDELRRTEKERSWRDRLRKTHGAELHENPE